MELACNLDDMTGEAIGHACEELFAAGALDVFTTAIGMKKAFPVWIDETAQLFDRIYVSGGKIGCQLHLAPDDLARAANASYADLTE